jgi:hypothetical protein
MVLEVLSPYIKRVPHSFLLVGNKVEKNFLLFESVFLSFLEQMFGVL